MTLHLTRYFGLSVCRMGGSNNRQYACFVAWYPRSKDRLGYTYFSIPII